MRNRPLAVTDGGPLVDAVTARPGRRPFWLVQGLRCERRGVVRWDKEQQRLTAGSSSDDPADPAPPAAPPQPIVQGVACCYEGMLPVDQFTENIKDLAHFGYFVEHSMMKAAEKYLLRLSACTAAYRTPSLMEQFIDASADVHQGRVNCCINAALLLRPRGRRSQAVNTVAKIAFGPTGWRPSKLRTRPWQRGW